MHLPFSVYQSPPSHTYLLIWSRIVSKQPTTANPTTLQPTPAPTTANPTTQNPTPNPTTANPTPTTPNEGSDRIIACGKGYSGCQGREWEVAGTNELHEVRCCRDCVNNGNCGNAWKQKCPGWEPEIYARSKVDGVCSGELDFYEARAFCAGVGGRLCTHEELLEECTRGTGCMYDREMIWAGMYDYGWCEEDSMCVSGNCVDGECMPENEA